MSGRLAVMRRAEEVSAGRSIDSYPLRLFAHHMAEIFGVSVKQFYREESAGAFLFAENRPRIGRKSWARDRVKAYLAGEITSVSWPKAKAS